MPEFTPAEWVRAALGAIAIVAVGYPVLVVLLVMGGAS